MSQVQITPGGLPRPTAGPYRHFATRDGRTVLLHERVLASALGQEALQLGVDRVEQYGRLVGRQRQDSRGHYLVVEDIVFPDPDHLTCTPTSVELSELGAARLNLRCARSHPTLDQVGALHTHPRHEAFVSAEDRTEQTRSVWQVTVIFSTASSARARLLVAVGAEMTPAAPQPTASAAAAESGPTVTASAPAPTPATDEPAPAQSDLQGIPARLAAHVTLPRSLKRSGTDPAGARTGLLALGAVLALALGAGSATALDDDGDGDQDASRKLDNVLVELRSARTQVDRFGRQLSTRRRQQQTARSDIDSIQATLRRLGITDPRTAPLGREQTTTTRPGPAAPDRPNTGTTAKRGRQATPDGSTR